MTQITFTGLTLATAITAFVAAFVFERFMDNLTENFRGAPSSDGSSVYWPCIRSTLDDCDNADNDKCWDYCCPTRYQCSRSPIVGLLCQDGENTCGDEKWCRDFADIPRTCPTETCQTHQMVTRVTSWTYILAAIGVFLDLLDIITIFTLADSVVFKSSVNIFSSLIKWIGFGTAIGAGTQNFISDLETARCFNADGMQLVKDAGGMFITYLIVQSVSAVLSLVLAPLSAYYGGKLQGVPYVK
jgi:hypothetical protein